MSKTIDEKVVSMQFDNRDFEKNVGTTMSTLDKLKRSLNLDGAAKGLESVGAAARNVDMSGVSSGVETVRAKFSALQVMGVTALANITNSAVNAGKRIASALTIDPIKTGFQEYETQINAVQTILANTQSKGTTLKDVNGALDELNTYADKTIYNFTEMTRNIGTFTAAGVDLDKSVTSIKGIANLAAVSGSTSQQASTAMYQLSQALAAGKVSLMDWNSVVNAGMGGQVFQDALKRTAKNMGTNVDAMIKKYGSFRESLTQGGWLTADVLTETLTQLSGAYSEADLLAKGYSKEQAKEILELADTAVNAATKVKTFTQLWDTLKEAAQSGWTQTWEIIVGDFEEAKSLLTEISDTVGGIIGKSAESRNALLQGWKDMGGRKDLIDSFRNVFEAFGKVVKPISEAFTDIFPPATAKQLHSITAGLKSFTEKLKISDETADKIKRTFKGVFSVVDMFRKVLVSVGKVIASVFTGGGVTGVLDLILSITAGIGDFFTMLNSGFKMGGITNGLTTVVSGISSVIGSAAHGLEGFGEALSKVGKYIAKVLSSVWDGITEVFSWFTENITAGDIFAGLTGGGIFLFAKKLSGVFDKISETIGNLFGKKGEDKEKLSIGKQFSDILGSVHDTLESFTSGIKIASLVSIAAAIAILTASLKTISKIKIDDISKSLGAIGIMFAMLSTTFKTVSKSLKDFPAKGIVKSGISMMAMAKAIDILATAMKKMADLSLTQLAKGLIGVGGGLYFLTKGLQAISGAKVSLSTSIAIIALAESCKTLADAMSKFGSLSWGEIARGLTGMGGALGELTLVLSAMKKVGGLKTLAGSASLFIAVQSLGKLADGLKKFGGMSWKEIGRGLSGMGGALTELSLATGVLGKTSGFSGILGASSLVIAVQSLGDLADALKKFGGLLWDEIQNGLIGMGGALAEVATITGLLGKLSGFSGIFGATSIVIAVQSLVVLADALQEFGSMTWDEIKIGLSGMGGALTEVAVVTGVLGKLTGLSGLLGSGTILLGVQGLGDLADALKKFGGMTWDEIARGLTGMGGALTEVAVVTGLLGTLAPLGGLVGSGSILLGVQGLGDLADALKKFGEMSWDEIGRGLTAMGAALGEIALGGLLNTLSIIGAYSISEIAEPLGVLADSVKKWSNVTVPENLGFQLIILADGVKAFTFSGLGASAISTCAEALGIMADSVKKWTDVVVPDNLPSQLGTLADGVGKFTFDGLGASALSSAAPAIGTMADSIKKWANVTIPDGLESGLTQIANGVKAFSWAFMGGWSLDTVNGPLGDLAGSISKWKDVIIPEGLEKGLTQIANGVKAFSLAFAGGWSLSTVTGPLGDLADSVKKWKDVTIPDKLGDNLKSLSDAVGAFSFTFIGGWSLGAITGPLGDLAVSVKKWKDVSIPSGLGTQLKTLAEAVKSFTGIGDVSKSTKALSSIATSTVKLSGIDFSSIAKGLNTLSGAFSKFSSASSSLSGVGTNIINNIVTPLKNATSQLSGAGSTLISSLAKGMKSKSGEASDAIGNIISKLLSTVSDKESKFKSAGAKLTSELNSGLKKNTSKVKEAMSSCVEAAISSIRDYYDNFYSAGSYLVTGFKNGISENSYKAAAKAKAMAKAAEEAAREQLKINSPSKVFRAIGSGVPEGFAQGISMFGSAIKKSTESMGNTAISNAQDSLSRLSRVLGSDIDLNTQPTIRPVLDLSNIEAGAGAINGMLSINPSVGVMANLNSINSSMNSRIQNGSNDDVVSAINGLKKAINASSGDTYQINGVTYDDGSNIADAVKTLVRAAKVERRT